jgi:4-carboxymuconolactone decarboxylase
MSQTGAASGGRRVTVSVLDRETVALVRLAAAIALGREELIAARAGEAVTAGVAPLWVDELLLQSVLMLGYPRALVGAAAWRSATGIAGPASDPSSTESAAEWRTRGEATCRLIYGRNYDRLRDNVRMLHPALDAWMVTEGYGRVLSRTGLDPARRELCTIAQIATLGTERQLHSHLRGALNAGATGPVLDEVLALVAPDLTGDLRDQMMRCWAGVTARREAS